MKNTYLFIILFFFGAFYSFGQCPPVAGSDGSTTVCDSSIAVIDLYSLISGEDAGGVWTRTSGTGGTFNAGAGTFTPASGATSSSFTYTLTGTLPCILNDDSIATVNINAQPDAGSNGSTTVCDSSVASIDLYSLISGEDAGGVWTRTSGTGGTFNAGAGTFVPASGATSSTFTYTLTGTAPCINDTSLATVTINAQPGAGSNGSTTVCDSSVASIDLFGLISGEDAGGVWTRTSGTGGTFNAGAGTFVPASGATSSTFTYTLTGTAPCINDTSVATITINAQPDAGSNGSTTVCDSSVASIDLFGLISGEDAGGVWTRTSGTGGTFNAGAGTFVPASGATSSTFTYTLTGTAPCINDTSVATVTINAQPDAGSNGSTTVCDSSVASIDLFGLISGEDAGGVWTRTSGTGGTFNAGAGTFVPASGATSSTFTYTLTGTAPCINDTSVATVTINAQPDAGSNGSTTVCDSSVASIDLFGLISGEDAGGVWTRTSGTGGTFNAGAGTFVPASGATSSTFTYTLTGTAPCINDTSVATVTINAQPDAGSNGSTTVCDSSVASIDLFGLISGEDAGGVWTRTSGTGGTFNAGAGTFVPASGATSSTFTYTLTGTAPCINDTSLATVTINAQPDAGSNGSTTVCDSSVASIDLYSLISGEDAGGIWTRTSGTGGTFNAGAGTFVPASGATSSSFTYTLTGTAPCINDTSVATITINAQPDAGSNGSTTVCDSSVASIDLFGLISGEDAGGVWTRTSGTGGTFNAGAGTFVPASGATSSSFTYTLTGTAPCINDASVATVTINAQPDAGSNGSTTVCDSSVASIDLYSLISGEDAGGVWTRTSGTGGTFNAGAGTFVPASGATSSTFTYTLTGTAPCINDTSVATITINAQPDAGSNGSTTVCDSSVASIDLFGLISGEDAGGVWTRTSGTGGTFNAGAGTFVPASGATSSSFTYTLTGTAPCINDASVATVTINAQPDAGSNGSTTVCDSSVASIDLFGLISGEDAGGVWTRTSGTGGTFNAGAGTFVPASGATSSSFTYTLTGTAPCINDASVATVTINAQPDAGSNGSTTVCDSSVASIDLFGLISGEDAGGVWTRTSGTGGTFNAGAGTFVPASGATSSTFTYTLTGTAPCINDTSLATVTINAQPDAGSNGSTTVCDSSVASIDLFGLISGEDAGGLWTRTSGTGGTFNAGAGTFVPASGATSSTFTYTLTGTAPCINDTSLATVTINAQPDAGSNGSTTVCDSSVASIDLFGLISGEDAGGVWTRTSGTGGTFNAGAGTFVPASGATSSTFTYTLTGTAPCINDTSLATVTINAQPDAGSNGSTTVCDSSVASISLFSLISGEDAGGVWTRTSGTGGTFNAGAGTFVPASGATSSTFTYTLTGTAPCINDASVATVNITPLPTATINYTGTPFCKSIVGTRAVTLTGTGAYTGGTYTSTAGLTINSGTGDITPSSSTAGTYTVTYTIPASGGCSAVPVTTSVTITAVPTAAISYAGSPFCKSIVGTRAVTLTGTGAYTGGTYTSTAGLTIVAGTGVITPSSSTAGTYTVTYTIPASGGCSAVPVTTSVTITAIPTATISYAGTPFCKSVATAQAVTLTGTGAYTGGTYTSTAGLTINSGTGEITPSSSTAGTYTVTYTIPASGGCSAVPVTTSITITTAGTASISYTGTPFCKSISGTRAVTLTGTGSYTGGTYSSTAGLTINSSTGAITPSSSTAGTYTVTYTIPANAGCPALPVTTSITITAVPTATISYAGNPYCISVTTSQAVTLTGTGAYTGGVYDSSPGGLTINTTTGAITPSSSSIKTYTVTYTIPASAGCSSVIVSTSLDIIATPTATINYAGTPFCKSVGTAQAVTLTGTGTYYTGGTYSSTAGLTINATTGAITPSTSTAGTYTVTYTVPATAGCTAITDTTSVTITAVPTAAISYAGTPFCKSIGTGQAVTLTGTGAYTGGAYTSTAGLIINSVSGAITPSTSTAGTYTVTYTIPASGGCAAIPVTTSVTITAVPTATISYTGTPFCKSVVAAQSVTLTGTGAYTGGTYSSTAGLTIDTTTGAITPNTSTAGTYTVTYTIPASAGCSAVPVTTSVTITVVPTATISYAGTPFCTSNASPQAVTLTGTGAYTGGTYTSTAGLSINSVSGAITPSTSTAGTYTVTYTIPASGGCSAVPVTTSVTINPQPNAGSNGSTTVCDSSVTPINLYSLITGEQAGGVWTQTSGTGGTFNAGAGTFTPASGATSSTFTYTLTGIAPCINDSSLATVNITPLPTAVISYAGTPFCKSIGTGQAATLTGTGAYTGGAYTSTAGLIINSVSGAITPSTSTAGTYTVTYTIPASGGCAAIPVTTSVTITAVPTATISYAGTPFCKSVVTAQSVTLTGTGAYTGGTYSSTAGLTINTTTGAITPGTSTAGTYTVTYMIPASAGCSAVPVTTSVTITAVPTAAISYAGTPFCKSIATAQAVTLTGTGAYTGGTYTSTAGLTIVAGTGAITPSSSTAGTYTVTYTIPASGGCAAVPVTTSVTITAIPTATISYAGTPFCKSLVTAQAVTLTGTGAYTGGTYSSTAGLTIDTTTGAITPSTSTAGTYTVTYTVPASGGCTAITDTTSVTITAVPTAAINYAGTPFCKSIATAQAVTLTGTGAYTGGNYTSTAGLTIVAGTGAITPSTSTAGTYTVTYTIPASAGCSAVPVTTSVTITAVPTAAISYSGTPFCKSIVGTRTVTLTGTGAYSGGTYTSTAGLSINSATGDITPSTSTAGTYTVTYTIPASAGCSAVSVTTSITITAVPTAVINYATAPFCKTTATAQAVTLTGTGAYTGGTYSSTAGLSIVAGTGAITPSSSTAGTYTVTYTIPASAGCSAVPVTTSVTINAQPNAGTDGSTTVCDSSVSAINLFSLITGEQAGGVWTRTSGTGGTFNAGAGTFTPATGATSSTFTYTLTGAAPCINDASVATITIKPTPVATAIPASQTICSGTLITTIALSSSVGSTTFSWTRDNTATVIGIPASGSGNISGALTNTTGTAITVTFTITPTANGCVGTPITATVDVEGAYVAGAVTVSEPGVTPVVSITTVCHSASGTLYLSGHVGSVVRWESSTTGGTSWTTIANTSDTYNYTNLIATTIFRAVIDNGSALCPEFYSAMAMINVIPNIKPDPVAATPSTICVGDSSVLSSESGYATSGNLASGGAFDNANPEGWLADGCGNCLNSGNSNTNPNPFRLSATNGGNYSGIDYASTGKFAIVNGAFDSSIETPVFNTLGLSTATLSFDHAYNLLAGAWAKVEISVDGGASYTGLLAQYDGPDTRSPYNAFPNTTIDLSAYLGQTNLRIRFSYHGVGASSWAIDNIAIPDVPVNLTTQWVDQSTGQVISNSASVTVSPIVTTTYAVTSFLNGCTSFGPEGTTYVTVTVNPRPTASIAPNQTICTGGTATFSITFTGTAPWNITYSNGATPTPTLTTVNNINTNPYVFSVPNITTNKVYSITALRDLNCIAISADFTGSATVTVLNGTQGLWTGFYDTDWFNCLNWAGGLPTSTINAVIPFPLTSGRMPIIDRNSSYAPVSKLAFAQDLIVASGASVTMVSTNNSELQISRDWKNIGSFIPGTGTVTFNGAAAGQVQTINAGIKLEEGFYNLTLSNTGTAKGVSVVDGFELTVANNLSLLSGDLRLTGEAQLVQAGTVANPSGGTGVLLRDQQGITSSYHYNYWSSPVSAENISYTISSVLRDGTDVTTDPFSKTAITFGDGVAFADGPLTTPRSLSNRWMFKYTLASTNYNAWQYIGSTGSVNVGEGYTMKGVTGTFPIDLLSQQNYVFVGKPNNGDISLSIASGQSYLIGNPYPSALDANKFIIDNAGSFDGVLLFWDHFGGGTHYLSQYVGGYARYNLSGGIVATSNDPMTANTGTSGSKIPQRYIPVGQGFFIGSTGGSGSKAFSVNGGPILFKNSQREFMTEASGSSIFIKNSETGSTTEEDIRPKIRLRFVSPSSRHRQLLVAADSNATELFDFGYDARLTDLHDDDLYWEMSNQRWLIQAIPDFNNNTTIPLGLKLNNTGLNTIKIDSLENIPKNMKIYLYDNLTGTYHDFKKGDFTISLPSGEYNNRFSLRFKKGKPSANEIEYENEINKIEIIHTQKNNTLTINNQLSDTYVQKVTLFNLIGRPVREWNVANENQQNISILIDDVSAGIYFVKIATNNGFLNKKIIVK